MYGLKLGCLRPEACELLGALLNVLMKPEEVVLLPIVMPISMVWFDYA